MIRDPSDGSVREKQEPSKSTAPPIAGESSVIEAKTSGLPLESQRAAYQEKLERSREWLRQRKEGQK